MGSLIRVPALGAAVANVTILAWAVQEGARVATGDTLVEVETDKMSMEIPAERSGVLRKIVAEVGDETQEGHPLAVLGEEGEDVSTLIREALAEAGRTVDVETPAGATTTNGAAAAAAATPTLPQDRVRATPVARRVARDHGVDIASVEGSGRNGLINRGDVDRHLAESVSAPSEPVRPPVGAPSAPAPSSARGLDDETTVIPYTGGRRLLGERLAESYRTAPHFTMFYEIDCSELVALRARMSDAFGRETGAKLSYLPFILKAVALAVEDVPIVNSTLVGEEIHVRRTANVGMAVAVGDMIVVPVVHGPASKSITEIGRQVLRLTELARSNGLTLPDVTGATITLSNVGNTDIASAFAIINQPEVAIVAVTKIVDRVVPIDGGIGVRPQMSVSFTYDHRVVQGIPGARFAERVKAYLEAPDELRA
jgi:pyruvate/2-oxoglutarate dehydrogenase complex dihydrolipoamide acyltransferase (E2) component